MKTTIYLIRKDTSMAMKKGARVRRECWDENEFIFLFDPVAHGMETVKYEISEAGETWPLLPFYMLHTRDGMTVPWGTGGGLEGCLASDWVEVR